LPSELINGSRKELKAKTKMCDFIYNIRRDLIALLILLGVDYMCLAVSDFSRFSDDLWVPLLLLITTLAFVLSIYLQYKYWKRFPKHFSEYIEEREQERFERADRRFERDLDRKMDKEWKSFCRSMRIGGYRGW
jgi:hypothetical protein